MNTFTTRILLIASLASVAHAQQDCSAVTDLDATCAAQTPGSRGKADLTGLQCADTCDFSVADHYNACCVLPKCDDATDAFDYQCPDGAVLRDGLDDPTAIDQDGTDDTCCRAKVATDCVATASFFCAANAGSSSAADPCVAGTSDATDACDSCTGFMVEPNSATYADAGGGAAHACGENTCNAVSEEVAAAMGVVITDLAGTETTISALAGAGGDNAIVEMTPAAGWTFEGTCTGQVASDSSDCAAVAAFVADPREAKCPTGDGCTFTPTAEITCPAASGGDFVVTGVVGMTCVLPTTAEPGTVITGMTCENMQTGSISCSTYHTCDAATHHPSLAGISAAGQDGLSGNSDDGVKCLADGAPLTLTVQNQPRDGGTVLEIEGGCNINMCEPPTLAAGYEADQADLSGATTVAALEALNLRCINNNQFWNADGTIADPAQANDQNWWSAGTCTGDVDDAVEGKVSGAAGDCSTWPAFVRTNQRADCPDGCTYVDTAATVTCTQVAGQADPGNVGAADFDIAGCYQNRCNDIDGAGAGTDMFSTCGKGMTIKGDLQFPCTGPTCDVWDCCTDDDGCAATSLGFDGQASTADDDFGPCYGTNSACVDVPAPGVGNECHCCDGDNPPSIRDETVANGGCAGSIGYFGATVISVDAATSADVVPVQGSCTACTPIANSAEEHTPPSTATDVDDADMMVTCERADDSRAVACVTGSIHVDNSANGVSDVCRLECPFTEVVALIDRLHIHTDGCAAVTLDDQMTEAQQTAACEQVTGCYYTPCISAGGAECTGAGDDVAATCRPIFAGCNAMTGATQQSDCDLGPKLSGDDNVLANAVANPAVVSTDDVSACTFDTDACKYIPAESAYTDTITRCDALLATNWAHDLRDSCDATRACPLHGAIDATPPGMIAMVKAVYPGAGQAPAGQDTWDAGDAPVAVGGSGANALTSLLSVSSEAGAYFLNDGDANSDTDWEVCMNIRDAVLAAPTCSAGAGR